VKLLSVTQAGPAYVQTALCRDPARLPVSVGLRVINAQDAPLFHAKNQIVTARCVMRRFRLKNALANGWFPPLSH